MLSTVVRLADLVIGDLKPGPGGAEIAFWKVTGSVVFCLERTRISLPAPVVTETSLTLERAVFGLREVESKGLRAVAESDITNTAAAAQRIVVYLIALSPDEAQRLTSGRQGLQDSFPRGAVTD